jgi:hypothetical protein
MWFSKSQTDFRKCIIFQVSSGKNLRTAEEGHKRATRAMNAAGDWIVQMEDSLQQVRQDKNDSIHFFEWIEYWKKQNLGYVG